jgi:hypothetical protein
MSEDLIVRHYAPTLAGLKTGNMFRASFADEGELDAELERLNFILTEKGLRITALRIDCQVNCGKCGIRALMYIYRPGQLQSDLDEEEAKAILSAFGYEDGDHEICIRRLTDRICECEEFPHEVGLFLGYPPEDVKGFIELGGRQSKASGYWKVYGDVDHAQKQFERFSKCTGVYLKCLERGLPFTKLAVKKKVTA